MKHRTTLLFSALLVLGACSPATDEVDQETATEAEVEMVKPVVYQVFTRLFGNQNTTNEPWGTIEQNGVGKFEDFTDEALQGIRELGVTHIWYTGVPHHAVIRDYTDYGISNDDPDVVKGRAGSPYAVRDYYSVNPDLAVDPANRLAEFDALIERTHANGMQVIIDIVPNHVARGYQSLARPDGVKDFGASDDTSVEWARDNNFYYVVGQDFAVPESPEGYAPLGGDPHPLADGAFEESPAKWTGNGAREAQPSFGDWFETVKVNYGVRPDGSYAFDRLPEEAREWTIEQHVEFWRDRDVPDSWEKFRDITSYWLDRGVDGFRYDMAEMVPVEFWSYLNSGIKAQNPDAFLLAEVYNPDLYRDYLQLGRMDYLYDKVGFYDTLKPIMQGRAGTETLAPVHNEVMDIERHMLHFLENHDEQRIASAGFAGDAERGRPAMVVSALISRSPTMIYFGQDVGEPGDGNAGFGSETRTTIFDYWGVPAHQRWMNGGAFDGGALSEEESALRDFYVRVMNFSATNPAMAGNYSPLATRTDDQFNSKIFAFARWDGDERILVASNFDAESEQTFLIDVPQDVIASMELSQGRYMLDEQLYRENHSRLIVEGETAVVPVTLGPLESVVLRVGAQDIMRHENFESAHVAPRHVDVWLPDGYGESNTEYAVIYAHDGQNLYNPEVTWNAQAWHIDDGLQRLMDEGIVKDAIVVGIWNTERRYQEYLPQGFVDSLSDEAGNDIRGAINGDTLSDQYLRFMVEELKPFIDSEYRTRPDRENTFVMGSSMGGLISLYAMISYPDVFAAAACVSTHWPLAEPTFDTANTERVVEYLRTALPEPGSHRFYFDYGTEELDQHYEVHQLLVDDLFVELGYTTGDDFVSLKYEGTGHRESFWAERVETPLGFLLAE